MDASIHSAADSFVGTSCDDTNTADEDDALRVVVAVEVGKICVDNQPTALARIFKALFVLLLLCCDRDFDHYRYCPHRHCRHYPDNKGAQADNPLNASMRPPTDWPIRSPICWDRSVGRRAHHPLVLATNVSVF